MYTTNLEISLYVKTVIGVFIKLDLVSMNQAFTNATNKTNAFHSKYIIFPK